MAEELEKLDEKSKKKLESRKFVVWLVWCLITLLCLAYCVAVIFITKNFTDSLSTLIEKVLGWFFGISLMYLGCNTTQKVGFAFADAMGKTEENQQ